jgi:peptidyl-prolyl cis-trans isomerase C
MKIQLALCALLVSAVFAQADSHLQTAVPQAAAGKPVARVNGVILTDRDLLREMYTIFPYARVHNGFPKEMEADIRKGALKMIVFEELVYQEAVRRKMMVPQTRMDRAMMDFRKQFPNQDEYEKFLKTETNNSPQMLRTRVRRSILIEEMLKLNVEDKAVVSVAEAKAYYDKNPDKFRIPDSLSLQTISILPPPNATPDQLKDVRKRAEAAYKQAKAARNYEEFGVLAEKMSEDDYRVMMGDHKAVDKTKMPPEILKAAMSMKDGQVSDLISVDGAFCVFRLNAHVPPGMQKFEAVKESLQKQLQKTKTEQLRSSMDHKLRAGAKVEEL